MRSSAANTGHCPTGVTSQDPTRQRAIVVKDKAQRVANFHHETVKSLAELLAAAGLARPADLQPHHIQRRVGDGRIVTFAEQFTFLKRGQLLKSKQRHVFSDDWARASAERF